jgi:hypothetical protein
VLLLAMLLTSVLLCLRVDRVPVERSALIATCRLLLCY